MRAILTGLSLALCAALNAQAQYAPQAGVPGSTAISKTSGQIAGWANGCTVRRGLQQIDDPSYGYASAGDSSAAIGPADGGIVSLGDSGVATLTFSAAVMNGPGPDFAVFENGFANISNPEEAFLELAFVEVSSDGVNFTRFPAVSGTQDTAQLSSVAGISYLNARQLHNLAGKYIGSWGTPFDLQELAGTPGLDITAITHIRIIDVVGSIGAGGSRDAAGRKVNDPFPTPFPGGGFDLDGVAVMHAAPASVRFTSGTETVRLFPNPAADMINVVLPEGWGAGSASIYDAAGRMVQEVPFSSPATTISIKDLSPGAYYMTLHTSNGATCTRAFLHR